MFNPSIVSIIIPVYNIEDYLEECLQSISKQTYPHIEAVIVDDGSTDSSGSIADGFAEKDSRIKVFHITNKGAAGARNFALNKCTGDYVMFVDSDDWIEDSMVETLLSKQCCTNADIVQCQYYLERPDKQILCCRTEQETICSNEEFMKMSLSCWENMIACNKLFKRSILQGVYYEEGHCIDDEYFTYKTVINAHDIAIIPEALYHYRMRRSSAMKNPENRNQRFLDQIDFVTKRYEPLINRFPSLKPDILEHLIEVLVYVIKGTNAPDIRTRSRRELFRYGLPALFDCHVSSGTKKMIVKYLFAASKDESTLNNSDSQDTYFD